MEKIECSHALLVKIESLASAYIIFGEVKQGKGGSTPVLKVIMGNPKV